jgi:CHAT domain-containing protein
LNEAARYYDQAIGLYDQMSFQPFSVVAHRGRLLTYLAQRDDEAAERELRVVLDLFEEHRVKIKEENNRTYFFEVAQEIYDAAIDFSHTRLNGDEVAFQYSEDSRARSLLAMMQGAGAPPVEKPYGSREIRDRMPEQVEILQYGVLNDKLLIWIISKSHFSLTVNDVTRDDLSKQVRDYLGFVTRPSSDVEDVRRASTALYESLIGPVHDKLVTGKTLCIVPDKILNHLPFAALTSPASRRYLIQDYAIIFSPSSNVFVLNTDLAKKKQMSAGEKLLSVGNPSFDRHAFASLPDLPLAASEARAVANLYDSPSPLVLTDRDARKGVVIQAMKDSDVLHLASHYVVNERWPMRSQLLLAQPAPQADSTASSDGSLLALDIYNMKLEKPRLAVLSACRTGVEGYYDGEGMIGMARTFLAAHVPLVIASQWPVDTASTNRLMVRFHEHRRRGQQTIEALRVAQVEIINDSSLPYRHPFYWAPFVTIGGYATF